MKPFRRAVYSSEYIDSRFGTTSTIGVLLSIFLRNCTFCLRTGLAGKLKCFGEDYLWEDFLSEMCLDGLNGFKASPFSLVFSVDLGEIN